jgi:hypothetical protein
MLDVSPRITDLAVSANLWELITELFRSSEQLASGKREPRSQFKVSHVSLPNDDVAALARLPDLLREELLPTVPHFDGVDPEDGTPRWLERLTPPTRVVRVRVPHLWPVTKGHVGLLNGPVSLLGIAWLARNDAIHPCRLPILPSWDEMVDGNFRQVRLLPAELTESLVSAHQVAPTELHDPLLHRSRLVQDDYLWDADFQVARSDDSFPGGRVDGEP